MLRVQYNRKAVQEYIKKYALSPNFQEYVYFADNDCTNFVSQVLRAGGMMEVGTKWDSVESWFSNTTNIKELEKISITWRVSRYFMRHWGNEDGFGYNRAYKFYKTTPSEFIKNYSLLYNNLEVGDVIQYGNPLPYHSQVVYQKVFNESLGRNDLLMAQHTANKINISLYRYVFKLLKNKNHYIYIYKIEG